MWKKRASREESDAADSADAANAVDAEDVTGGTEGRTGAESTVTEEVGLGPLKLDAAADAVRQALLDAGASSEEADLYLECLGIGEEDAQFSVDRLFGRTALPPGACRAVTEKLAGRGALEKVASAPPTYRPNPLVVGLARHVAVLRGALDAVKERLASFQNEAKERVSRVTAKLVADLTRALDVSEVQRKLAADIEANRETLDLVLAKMRDHATLIESVREVRRKVSALVAELVADEEDPVLGNRFHEILTTMNNQVGAILDSGRETDQVRALYSLFLDKTRSLVGDMASRLGKLVESLASVEEDLVEAVEQGFSRPLVALLDALADRLDATDLTLKANAESSARGREEGPNRHGRVVPQAPPEPTRTPTRTTKGEKAPAEPHKRVVSVPKVAGDPKAAVVSALGNLTRSLGGATPREVARGLDSVREFVLERVGFSFALNEMRNWGEKLAKLAEWDEETVAFLKERLADWRGRFA
ncbi:MAG: hypothetical protein Kow0069_13090 [Promethearchaeota archaeon]